MRRLLLFALFVLVSGCITPHSAVFGLTPTQMHPGEMELGLSPGVAFQAVNSPPVNVGGGVTATTTTRNLGAPVFEGNAQWGLTDNIGLNVHLSSAGLQPGVKISLPAFGDRIHLAVLPEFALGVASQGSGQSRSNSTTVTDRGGSANLYVMGGFKLLASHSSGLYAGLGYDFQRISTEALNGGTRRMGSVQTLHNIGLAIGYEVTIGAVTLRPELAIGLTPSSNTWNINGTAETFAGTGSEILLFPNVTVALGSSGGPPPTPPPEGLKPEDLSMPPVFPAQP